jgi:hypothetical protein
VESRRQGAGQRWEIVARLNGPTGSATIKSVWFLGPGETVPRFITLYPA